MKGLIFFDKVALLFILAAFFTVGIHLGGGRRSEEKSRAEITVAVEKIKGIPSGEILIDGKYGCTLVSYSEKEIIFSCEGLFSEAGFLLSGAKYVSKNQPIKVFSQNSYFEGRIIFISAEPPR